MPLIKDTNSPAFLESECTITHEGRTFTSNGACFARRVDTGLYEGILYAQPPILTDSKGTQFHNQTHPFRYTTGRGELTSWSGEIRIPAHFGRAWYSNFGDKRQLVYLTYSSLNFWGIWYSMDWSQIVRIKQLRPSKREVSSKMIVHFEHFTIEMTKKQALSASHQGACDEDVQVLLASPKIYQQLAKISDTDLSAELRDYGAWGEAELFNRDDNNARIIWIAAGRIREEVSTS